LSEGEPLHGDRGAWDVLNYENEHARDINDATLRRHLPAPGAAGEIAVSDGTDWFSDPLVSFGAGAPATTYPGKLWVDTS